MAGNFYLRHHMSISALLALSAAVVSIAVWQPYLRLSVSDVAAAGAFWWSASKLAPGVIDAVLWLDIRGAVAADRAAPVLWVVPERKPTRAPL